MPYPHLCECVSTLVTTPERKHASPAPNEWPRIPPELPVQGTFDRAIIGNARQPYDHLQVYGDGTRTINAAYPIGKPLYLAAPAPRPNADTIETYSPSSGPTGLSCDRSIDRTVLQAVHLLEDTPPRTRFRDRDLQLPGRTGRT